MRHESQLARRFESVFQEGCEKCQIMHTYYGITMFVTPIFRERIGHFPMLKAHTPFAIDSQKDLNAHKHLTSRNLPPRVPLRAPPNQVLSLRRVPWEIGTT